MKGAIAFLAVSAALSLLGSARVHGGQAAGLTVPDGQAVLCSFAAKGVQIYESRAKADKPGEFEWAFRAPDAKLADSDGKPMGIHYAGPTWELADGGKVTAKKVSELAKAGAVPWLLLQATGASGSLEGVTYVMRVDTHGGLAPATPPQSAGATARVAYTATYLFLTKATTE